MSKTRVSHQSAHESDISNVHVVSKRMTQDVSGAMSHGLRALPRRSGRSGVPLSNGTGERREAHEKMKNRIVTITHSLVIITVHY